MPTLLASTLEALISLRTRLISFTSLSVNVTISMEKVSPFLVVTTLPTLSDTLSNTTEAFFFSRCWIDLGLFHKLFFY